MIKGRLRERLLFADALYWIHALSKTGPVMTSRKKSPFPPSGSAEFFPAASTLPASESGSINAPSFKTEKVAQIASIRGGMPAGLVPALAERFGISEDALLTALRLPVDTMNSQVSQGDFIAALQQDRLYRAEKMWSRAVEVLEDQNAARAWIVQRNRSLGGVTPLSLLATEAGYALVMNTLGHIDYGVVS